MKKNAFKLKSRVIILNKISDSKNYIWSFPLLAGIVTMIGLLTPSSAFKEVDINWMWGLKYSNIFAVDSSFDWIFDLAPKHFTQIIFICKIIPFFIFLAISILSIIFALKLRKSGDFRSFERRWLLCGVSFIILGVFYIIEIEILMQYFYEEHFGLDISYWEEYTPGFAVIAPFISGAVILIGFFVNKYVLVPEKRDLIIRVTKLYRNIIYSFLIVIFILLIGVTTSFIILKLMPGDPVLAYLPLNFTLEQYEAVEHALGLDLHIIIQFFRYLGNFFIGNWGISHSFSGGAKVTGLIIISLSRMIGLLVLPLIIGLGSGIWLGKVSYRYRGRWMDKLIQILSALGISMPVFFFGMVLQFFLSYKLNIFSALGTYIVPMYIMTLSIFALITWQTRSHMVNKPYETSILPNTIKIAKTFGFVFMLYLLLDVTFSLGGLGTLLGISIHSDFYLISGVLFALIITFVIVILISNLIFSYNKYREGEIYQVNFNTQIDNDVEKNNEDVGNEYEESVKVYFLRRLKSPYFVIGAILVIFFIFISIFPQSLTEYTFEEAKDISLGSWNPPSPDHPLGQTKFGWDVLALVIYGIRTSMFVGFGAVLIGLIFGGHFGFVTGIFNRRAYKPMMGFMILFYLFPGLVFVMLANAIYGTSFLMSMIVIGVLLIPSFTRVIANAVAEDINIHRIIKKVICHIPLNFAFAILIYEAIGFLGFGDIVMIELGDIINAGRLHLYDAPWATLWPGLAIFGLVLSFLIFHVGLQGYDPKLRELENLDLE